MSVANAAHAIARLLRDTRGSASTQLLSFSPTWFVVFGVFMMNVQLVRSSVQRDMVDHATALAADATMKTLCADGQDFGGAAAGELTGARADAVRASIEPVLGLVSSDTKRCRVTTRPTQGGAGSSASGARAVEVELTCEFPCEIPIAAHVMCSGSPPHVTFSAKQTTVAMGCDTQDGS
jgi:hypothetical protein